MRGAREFLAASCFWRLHCSGLWERSRVTGGVRVEISPRRGARFRGRENDGRESLHLSDFVVSKLRLFRKVRNRFAENENLVPYPHVLSLWIRMHSWTA